MTTRSQLQNEKINVDIAINETIENLNTITSETQEEEEELDVLTLTLPQRPGSDLSSKLLLRDEKMKDIVVSAVTGQRLRDKASTVTRTTSVVTNMPTVGNPTSSSSHTRSVLVTFLQS